MDYSLYYSGVDRQIRELSGINETTIREIIEAIDRLCQRMNEIDYFFMVMGDVEDFLNAAHCDWPQEEVRFSDLNRYMMNLLNAYYVWVEYHKHHWGHEFSKEEPEKRQQNFEYGVAHQLRHYATHNSLCITRISYDLINNTKKIQIMIDDLLKDPKISSTMWLKEMLLNRLKEAESIDAEKFVFEFRKEFCKRQAELWENAGNAIDEIVSLIKKILEMKGETRKISECFIATREGDNYKNVRYISALVIKYIEKQQCALKILNEFAD